MCRESCVTWRRAGLTLLEVLAALALLSTLLIGILVSFRDHAAQIRAAQAARQAAAATEELVYQWASQGRYPPPYGEGPLPGVEGLRWHTRVVSHRWRDTLGLEIVRLEVHLAPHQEDARPLLALELPVPATPPDSQKEVVP